MPIQMVKMFWFHRYYRYRWLPMFREQKGYRCRCLPMFWVHRCYRYKCFTDVCGSPIHMSNICWCIGMDDGNSQILTGNSQVPSAQKPQSLNMRISSGQTCRPYMCADTDAYRCLTCFGPQMFADVDAYRCFGPQMFSDANVYRCLRLTDTSDIYVSKLYMPWWALHNANKQTIMRPWWFNIGFVVVWCGW